MKKKRHRVVGIIVAFGILFAAVFVADYYTARETLDVSVLSNNSEIIEVIVQTPKWHQISLMLYSPDEDEPQVRKIERSRYNQIDSFSFLVHSVGQYKLTYVVDSLFETSKICTLYIEV